MHNYSANDLTCVILLVGLFYTFKWFLFDQFVKTKYLKKYLTLLNIRYKLTPSTTFLFIKNELKKQLKSAYNINKNKCYLLYSK